MGKRTVKKIQGETLEERKTNAVRVVGRNGVYVVRPDESVEALEIDKGDKPRAAKSSKREPPRKTAPSDLSKGYEAAARLAERRATRVMAWSEYEGKQYLKVARYCRVMANAKLIDEPQQSKATYTLDSGDELILSEIQARKPDPTRWNPDRQMALDAALAMLSDQERVVVNMYYGARMKRPDIAKALEVSVATVKVCVERARKKWVRLRQNGEMPTKL